ncbi:MAG: helix-turn-helix transcriptional regulator [Mobilicoccus sp.]|nr:helix-turn-helix transcriptional regulator [Mobilicoccus sp.]
MDTPDDAEIGARIQHLREAHGLTQSALAADMAARGHQWHQQTVVKTEKGLRPLRLTEACDLADALHGDLADLTGDVTDAGEAVLRSLLGRCLDADDAIDRAHAAAHAARTRLAAAAADRTDLPPDLADRIHRALHPDAT